MKSLHILIIAGASLLCPLPTHAEEEGGMKCGCMKAHEARMADMKKKADSKMMAEDAELKKWEVGKD